MELPLDLNQVTLPVRDLAASIDFYRRFGLRRIVDSPATDYARFEVTGGDATLSIHVERAPVRGPRVAVYFEAADPDAVVARLREAGIEPDAPLGDRPWLWREAGFLDPSGNRLIVYRAGESRKNPPWRVDAAS
jgi:catechol 2,3-dioxygenase-like lactoylglutathione lyase family enzyme